MLHYSIQTEKRFISVKLAIQKDGIDCTVRIDAKNIDFSGTRAYLNHGTFGQYTAGDNTHEIHIRISTQHHDRLRSILSNALDPLGCDKVSVLDWVGGEMEKIYPSAKHAGNLQGMMHSRGNRRIEVLKTHVTPGSHPLHRPDDGLHRSPF